MLPAANRLRESASFRDTVRRGRRVGGRLIVVHLLRPEPGCSAAEPRAGLVVSKAVGPAVVRNRVKRRLRHQLRERLAQLPASGMLVVRALPAAAGATYADLGRELDRALTRLSPEMGADHCAVERPERTGETR